MKTTQKLLITGLTLLALATLNPQLSAAPSLGTAFTYQGRLMDGGAPVTGNYDFWFKLYDDPVSGTQQGGTVTTNAMPVTNGLFTITLDFGAVFTGNARWLDIYVHNSTNDPGVGWVCLAPRQPLTPAPYALYAPNAGASISAATATTATTASGVADNAVTAPGIASGQVVKTLNALKDNVTLAPGANVTLTPSGQTLTLATPTDWHVVGNGGTTPGVNFLGTTDNQPLELWVNGGRALRIEPTWQSPTFVGGSPLNSANGTIGAVIGGGGNASTPNTVTGHYGVVGGGAGNSAGLSAVVVGGGGNTASGQNSVIGGGSYNQATNDDTVVGGGNSNVAGGDTSTISGGAGNLTTGDYSIIGGGYNNQATNGTTVVGGGLFNVAGGDTSTVSGGSYNHATGLDSAIGGGALNQATNEDTVVGGGLFNVAAGDSSTVSGGWGNQATGAQSVIGGGYNNQATYINAVVGGGDNNVAGGDTSTVSGGGGNQALGNWSSVPGGRFNTAQGAYSLAAGLSAKANHDGAFVWADSTGADFASTANDQFAIRAQNGVVIQAQTNGTALELRTGGAIKVTGAGVGTGTPIFIQRATSGNISGNQTIIDNPLCNGDSGAILIVTHNYNASGMYENHPFGVWYNGTKWTIYHEDSVAMPVGQSFNVMIIKP